jgi:hypothetical protein
MRLLPPPGESLTGYQVFAWLVIFFLFWPLAVLIALRFIRAIMEGYREDVPSVRP